MAPIKEPGMDAQEARLHLSPGYPVGITEEMIETVVHGFYDRIRIDPALGPIFNRVIPAEAWPAHLSKMCDFWSSVMLMSGRFHGAPCRAAPPPAPGCPARLLHSAWRARRSMARG